MFKEKDLIFTAETTPDLSMDLKSSVQKIIPLVGLADAVNVTDSPNCKTKLSSILVAAEIKKKGLDVILQLTGRDRNRIAIESEIIGAASIDINKVLCLTGDQPDPDGPKAVNEFNGASLIELINVLNSGKITDGTEVSSPKMMLLLTVPVLVADKVTTLVFTLKETTVVPGAMLLPFTVIP